MIETRQGYPVEKTSLFEKMQKAARGALETMRHEEKKQGTISFESPRLLLESIPTLWKEQAEFLPDTKAFLSRCGVDPAFVNPVPMGEGLNHIVFFYQPIDGKNRVVKVVREASKGVMHEGVQDEKENIDLAKKYFGAYVVPTDIVVDPESDRYVVIQDMVEGKPVNSLSQTSSIDVQLQDIMKSNQKLYKETGYSLDFLGTAGFGSWVRHQFVQYITHKNVIELANVLVDTEGKIRMIDYDMFRTKNGTIFQKTASFLGMKANAHILKRYFGVIMNG